MTPPSIQVLGVDASGDMRLFKTEPTGGGLGWYSVGDVQVSMFHTTCSVFAGYEGAGLDCTYSSMMTTYSFQALTSDYDPGAPPLTPSQVLPDSVTNDVLPQLLAPEVSVDWDGIVTVAGTSVGSVDLGGGVLSPVGSSDVIIAKFQADGSHLWSKRFAASAAGVNLLVHQTSGGNGSVSVWGPFGSIDFGGGPIMQGGNERYLVKLDADGNVMCTRVVIADSAMAGPAGEVWLLRWNNYVSVDGTELLSGVEATACNLALGTNAATPLRLVRL